MDKEDLEKLDSVELQKIYNKLGEDREKLREKERKLEDFQDFINYLLPIKKREEHLKHILNIAKSNEEKAIDIFGGKKYVFTFGGFRYIPIKKCLNKKQLDIVNFSMHNGVGIVNSDYLYETYKKRDVFSLAKFTPEYEHSDFYTKSTLKRVDLFYCLENGYIFIPTSYELMHVDNETLKKIGIYDDYSSVLETNEYIEYN